LRRHRRLDPFAGALHEGAAVHLVSGVLVVCAAEQVNLRGVVAMRPSEPVFMLEFQPVRGAASATPLVHECAAPAVALIDGALDGVGDVPGSRRPRAILPGLGLFSGPATDLFSNRLGG
jgi:hypothetical protein